MIAFEKVKRNRIYLNQKISLKAVKAEENKNTAIVLCGTNIESNIELLNAQFINPNYCKNFCSLYTYKIKGKNFRFMNNELYRKIRRETFINKCSNNLAVFTNKPVYLDISTYLANIFERYRKYTYQQKRKFIFDAIISMLQAKLNSYDRIILLMDIKEQNIEFKDNIRYNQTNLLNSIISSYRFPLDENDIVLPDKFEIFWVNTKTRIFSLVQKEDFRLKSPARLRRIVKILTRDAIKIEELDDTDKELLDDGKSTEVYPVKDISFEIENGLNDKELVIQNDLIKSRVERVPTKNSIIDKVTIKTELKKDSIKVGNQVNQATINTFNLDMTDNDSDSDIILPNASDADQIDDMTNEIDSDINNSDAMDSDNPTNVIRTDEPDDSTAEEDSFDYDDFDTSELDGIKVVDKENSVNAKKRAAQIQRLRKKANQVKVDELDRTLQEILDMPEPKEFKPREIKQLNTLNETNKHSGTANFNSTYMEELFEKDQMEVLNSFSDEDKTIPVFITKITRQDSSDSFNKKETMSITFQDVNNVKHTFTIDVPKLIDDRYIFVNNSKKVINKQLIALPVVKTGVNRVQVTTNYNKTLLERFGSKITNKVEKFLKFVSVLRGSKNIEVILGKNISDDTTLKSYIEYDTIGFTLTALNFGEYRFIFDRRQLIEQNQKNGANELCIGFGPDNQPIQINNKTGFIIGSNEVHFIDFIVDKMDEFEKGTKYREMFDKTKGSTKFTYTRCSILGRKISLFLVLAFKIGISELLKLMKLEDYGFSEKHPRFILKESIDNYTIYKFKDGYFYFNTYPISNSLILNGLNEIPCEELTFNQLDQFDTYLDIFEDLFNSKAIIKGFDNFVELMLDPITKNICKDLGLPTDFYNLMIYANTLLDDNHKLRENDMSQYRLRSNEIINAYLYQILGRAYADYKNSYTNNNPQKISVQKNALIRALQEDKLVENYSTLNPIKEADTLSTFTWRGLQGLNLDEGFKLDKRAFDETMLGVSGLSSPYNRNVGVSRQLAVNPSIKSPRGYIESGDKGKEYSEEQTMTFSEILNPFVTTHDDAPRIAMGFQQSGHMIPGNKNDPALITYGMDRALPYYLSDDFVAKAKDDGTIVDIKDDFMFIEYNNGKREVINIGTEIEANGGGGFFMDIQKKTHFKKGDKIKEDDILCSNEFFFKDCGFGTQYLTGTLTKVAVIPGYFNYEDSTICTENFGRKMSTPIIKRQVKVLEPNSTVDFIAKKGAHVNVGDTLIKFEPAFEESEVNEFLKNMGEEFNEQIDAMSRNLMVSKNTGVIKDVKIYYTCDYEKLSPSLKQIIDNYKKEIDSKHKNIVKFFGKEAPNIILPPTERYVTENGKIKGQDIGEAVMFEYYIEHDDVLGIGSKLTFSTALKGVVSSLIPDEQAPYTENKPDEEISCMLSPISINARMTGSVWYQLYANKVMIELTNQVKQLYYDNK